MLGVEDSVKWKYDPLGKFSTKSFSQHVHRLACTSSAQDNHASWMWKGLAPPRAKLLLSLFFWSS